jgi:hypothetical protein
MPQIDLHTLLELVGDLDDSTEPGSPSERFRKYLQGNIQQVNDVRAYVKDALAQPGDQYNKALQDLINHIGQLLGFTVEYGRYRGVRGDIGFDGLWQSETNWSIVVEAKTTDVYTVKTATLLGYINSLVSEGQIKSPTNALGLYVYGRFDAQTNQLENAITVEGRREGLRVVSVEALLNLLELKQEYKLAHSTVLGLLLPAPVKVDALVNLIFDIVAQEKEEGDIPPETEASEELEEPAIALKEPKQKRPPVSLASIDEDYAGKTAKSVIFLNRHYEVHTWKEIALVMFEALLRLNQQKFEEVSVTIRGRKRPYISYDKSQLRTPEIIPGTNLYFETNLSATSIAKLCYTLVMEMGYKKTDLQFEVEP